MKTWNVAKYLFCILLSCVVGLELYTYLQDQLTYLEVDFADGNEIKVLQYNICWECTAPKPNFFDSNDMRSQTCITGDDNNKCRHDMYNYLHHELQGSSDTPDFVLLNEVIFDTKYNSDALQGCTQKVNKQTKQDELPLANPYHTSNFNEMIRINIDKENTLFNGYGQIAYSHGIIPEGIALYYNTEKYLYIESIGGTVSNEPGRPYIAAVFEDLSDNIGCDSINEWEISAMNCRIIVIGMHAGHVKINEDGSKDGEPYQKHPEMLNPIWDHIKTLNWFTHKTMIIVAGDLNWDPTYYYRAKDSQINLDNINKPERQLFNGLVLPDLNEQINPVTCCYPHKNEQHIWEYGLQNAFPVFAYKRSSTGEFEPINTNTDGTHSYHRPGDIIACGIYSIKSNEWIYRENGDYIGWSKMCINNFNANNCWYPIPYITTETDSELYNHNINSHNMQGSDHLPVMRRCVFEKN